MAIQLEKQYQTKQLSPTSSPTRLDAHFFRTPPNIGMAYSRLCIPRKTDHPSRYLYSMLCGSRAGRSGTCKWSNDQRIESMRIIATAASLQDEHLFFSEIVYEDQGMRLVFDVDCAHALKKTAINTIINFLLTTLRRFYGNAEIPVFVSTCGPQLKPRKGPNRDDFVVSMGIHLVCHVIVNMAQAQTITSEFARVVDASSLGNDNAINVDSSIYRKRQRSVSLRQIYSRKYLQCPLCMLPNCSSEPLRALRINSCDLCDNGYVATKPYEPYAHVTTHQRSVPKRADFICAHTDYFTTIKNHSAFAVYRDQEFKRSTHFKCPDDVLVARVQDARTSKRKKTHTAAQTLHGHDSEYNARRMDDDDVKSLTSHLQKLTGHTFAITRTQRLSNLTNVYTNNSFCPHVERDHSKNKVFYTFYNDEPWKVYLKCNSMSNGCTTKVYSMPITRKIQKIVFGKATYPRKKARPNRRL